MLNQFAKLLLVATSLSPVLGAVVKARVGRKSGFIAPSAECNTAHRARLGKVGSCGGRRRQKAAGFSALRFVTTYQGMMQELLTGRIRLI